MINWVLDWAQGDIWHSQQLGKMDWMKNGKMLELHSGKSLLRFGWATTLQMYASCYRVK